MYWDVYLDHKTLLEIAEHDPDTEEIFEDNLLDTYYPQRPTRLEDVCLYDFVANYDWYGKDANGDRKYSKLKKPCLTNHIKLFDPEKEAQREDYYYSLILLFVPFQTESSLLLDNERAEEAFYRLVNTDCSSYHARLQMLEAQSNIKINEARHADGEEEISKDDKPQLMGEAKTAMIDIIDVNVKSSSDLSLESRVAMPMLTSGTFLTT